MCLTELNPVHQDVPKSDDSIRFTVQESIDDGGGVAIIGRMMALSRKSSYVLYPSPIRLGNPITNSAARFFSRSA